MIQIRPVVLSFSLLAFAGAAYAADEKKSASDSRAKPAMSQSDNKSASKASAGASDSASAGASKDRSAASQQTGGAMSAKKLIGTDVVDAQGKDLGEIKEVVLDLHNARVHAAVLEFGGFLGIGDKQYAFPVSELKSAKQGNKLALNVDKKKLEKEKGFEKNKWPAMDDAYWGTVGDKAAAGGTKPPSGQKMNLHRASKLIGQNVQDRSGQQAGEIEDILLSEDRSKIRHIVIDVKGAGQARIEPKQLSLGTGDKLVLDMSAGQLKSQAGKRDKQTQSDAKPSATAASGSASAAATAHKKSFSELDKDNDGTLSQMEAAGDADAKSNFEKLDENNDRKLSREEWQAGQGAAAGATGSSGSSAASKSSGTSSGATGSGGKPEPSQPKSK